MTNTTPERLTSPRDALREHRARHLLRKRLGTFLSEGADLMAVAS